MAKFDLKGLLYSPEVLGGLGLLGAGLQGKTPAAALPNLLQGIQASSVYGKLQEEEKKRKFIEKYGETLPEGQERDLFNLDPATYIKNKLEQKKPNLVNMIGGQQKTPITLNLSNPQDLAKFRELKAQGFYEVGKPTVQATSIEGITGLSKTGVTQVEKEIIGGENLLANLERMEAYFDPEFLKYQGKAKDFIFSALSRAGLSKPEQDAFLQRFNTWEAANEQYFNQYRKLITGVAAGEKEIGWLQSSIPSSQDSPAVYQAKLKLQKNIQQGIINRAKLFRERGLGATVDENGQATPEFKKFLKENRIIPGKSDLVTVFDSYISSGYPPEQIEKIMNVEFKGIDWKSILMQ
jgi:hypothetical protein